MLMNSIDTAQDAGFREREHTADWELEVWAPDLPGLLEQAARGMYQLAGTRFKQGRRLQRDFELPISDEENLIVDFLSELLFLAEDEGVAFDEYSLEIVQDTLRVELTGAPIDSMDKEIKAVTYHKLDVRLTELGVQVNIIFDV
jgi:SHS2 domain-containing protein